MLLSILNSEYSVAYHLEEKTVLTDDLSSLEIVEPITILRVLSPNLDQVVEFLAPFRVRYEQRDNNQEFVFDLLKRVNLTSVTLQRTCTSQVAKKFEELLNPTIKLTIRGDFFDEWKFAPLIRKVSHLSIGSIRHLQDTYENITHFTVENEEEIREEDEGYFNFPNLVSLTDLDTIHWNEFNQDFFEQFPKLQEVKLCQLGIEIVRFLYKFDVKKISLLFGTFTTADLIDMEDLDLIINSKHINPRFQTLSGLTK
jgi:hypothetical protein